MTCHLFSALQHYTPSLSTPRLTTSAIISKSYLICTVVVHASVIAGVLELPLEKLRITGPKARNSELRGLKIKPPRQNPEKLAFQTLYSLVKEQCPLGSRLMDIFKLDLFLHQWWAWQELNLRPHAYQACALTTELQARITVRTINYLKEKTDTV